MKFTWPYASTLILALGFGLSSVPSRAENPPNGNLNRSVSISGGVPSSTTVNRRGSGVETEASCGLACRYHQANDNLTLQALYLVTKIQKIGEELGRDTESMSARTALGGFCKTTAEDLEACYNRYKAFQRVALLEIRQAIGKNEDTLARLTTGRKADGTVEGTALVYETGTANAPYLPDMPTLAELEASYLKGKLKPAGSKYSREEIQKWSQELVINNPKARYLEFSGKPVVGNPFQNEKTSYSLYMEKRDEQGRPLGADERAVKLHQQSEKEIREFAEDKNHEIADREIKVVTPTKKLKDDDEISYNAFTQARSIVNSKVEKDTKLRDAEETNRKVASDMRPKPHPSASPSPVPVTGNGGVSRDVKVTTGNSALRAPSGYKTYGDDEKLERPTEMKNSRYIKYDINDLLKDIGESTK